MGDEFGNTEFQNVDDEELVRIVRQSGYYKRRIWACRILSFVVPVLGAMAVIPMARQAGPGQAGVSMILFLVATFFLIILCRMLIWAGFFEQPKECSVGEVRDMKTVRHRDSDGHTRKETRYLVWDGTSHEWCNGSRVEKGTRVVRYRCGKSWYMAPYEKDI